jgi:anaerobic magnesium-protoporphyrin IX monomethyl ester cyclase
LTAAVRVLLVDCNPFMAAAAPISLGYLGAVLRAGGHEVEILSLGSDSKFSVDGLASWLRERRPQLVGFGAYQRNMLHVGALARLAKVVLPSCRVVLGGPQGMFLPDVALDAMLEVDFLSRGEGELAIRAIVESMEAGAAPGTPIPGVTSRLPEGGCVTGLRPVPPDDLDTYPSPWLDGVLEPSEWSEALLLTSRGCPHRCLFCLTPAAFGNIRCHSLDRVLAEIEYLAERGNRRLWFADPNFCADAERVVAMLEGILARGLEVSMWIEVRADIVSVELASLMRRAGVERVAMGLESASPTVLAGLDKGIEPEQIRRAARTALSSGVDVELFSQYALPGESLDDALTTLRFVQDCGVAIRGNSNAQQMQLYFGSDITRNHREYGVRPLRECYPSHLSIGTEFETDWMRIDDIARVRAAWRDASEDGGQRIVS